MVSDDPSSPDWTASEVRAATIANRSTAATLGNFLIGDWFIANDSLDKRKAFDTISIRPLEARA